MKFKLSVSNLLKLQALIKEKPLGAQSVVVPLQHGCHQAPRVIQRVIRSDLFKASQ